MTWVLGVLLSSLLVTATLVALFGRHHERRAAALSLLGFFIHAVCAVTLIAAWLFQPQSFLEWDFGSLYRSGSYEFPLVFFFDRNSAVFLGVTVFLAAIIIKFCRYYLHRESGYARFFSTIFVFLFGVELLAVAGTLDLLFVGWEFLGISSFLLIGFYRERATPQRNALRAYSIYRLCDLGFVLGAWITHLLWHQPERFSQVSQMVSQVGLAHVGQGSLIGLSLVILLAASGKSGQFPFTFWLARAMEGPTPSSAIFYGALSIHAGVFLLLRTQAIWSHLWVTQMMVGAVGLITTLISILSGRVQSNIKAQIAYASIAQVGLMLVELAMGWHELVLIHFVGNALLRCYQILISPSVVAQLIRLQARGPAGLTISDWSWERWLPRKVRDSLYVLAINEGYLESMIRATLWSLPRRVGEVLGGRFASRLTAFLSIATLVVTFVGAIEHTVLVTGDVAFLVLALALMTALIGFSERQSALKAWNFISLSSLMVGLVILVLHPDSASDILFYYSGIIPGGALGAICLARAESKKRRLSAAQFHGRAYRHPIEATVFFFGFLSLAAFPISPSFIGLDLLFHHAVGVGPVLPFVLSTTFVLNGIAAARVFCRVYFGPAARAVNLPLSAA